MSVQKRKLAMLPVKKGNATHIKVELYYTKGGMNYFSGKTDARGLYLSVSPVSISSGDGYTTETYSAYSGVKRHVHEMSRFSQSTLEKYEVDQSEIDELVDYVCEKNQIELHAD